MLWDISQAWLVWQDVQSMETAPQAGARPRSGALKEAQQEGLDLSDAALQVLPKEIEFAGTTLSKNAVSPGPDFSLNSNGPFLNGSP